MQLTSLVGKSPLSFSLSLASFLSLRALSLELLLVALAVAAHAVGDDLQAQIRVAGHDLENAQLLRNLEFDQKQKVHF